MIHFVVNNAEELRRTINGVGAPSLVKTTTSILVVNMLGLVVHKRGPLITSSRISSNAILKEVILTTPGEVVVRCLHFNVHEKPFLHNTNRGLRDRLDIASGALLQDKLLGRLN